MLLDRNGRAGRHDRHLYEPRLGVRRADGEGARASGDGAGQGVPHASRRRRAADRSLMAKSYVIVGASLAGATAAVTLREEGADGSVTMIGAERQPPYERPP